MNTQETLSTVPPPEQLPLEPAVIALATATAEMQPEAAVSAAAPACPNSPPLTDGAALREMFESLGARLAGLESLVEGISKQLSTLAQATAIFDTLGLLVESINKQLGFLPPQVRALGGKIEGVAVSLGDSRYRGLLQDVLLIFDLVDQPLRASTSVPDCRLEGEPRRNQEVLRTQLRQILEANGLSEISTEGAFDPKWQRALETIATDNPAHNGMVCRALRPGFRAANSVLRYAEVSVWSFVSKPDSAPCQPKNETVAAADSAAAQSSPQTLPPASDPPEEKSGEATATSTLEQTETKI